MTTIRDAIDEVVAEVRDELERAMSLYPVMNSPAEGISVLREEFEEAWEIVKQRVRGGLGDRQAEARQACPVRPAHRAHPGRGNGDPHGS